MVTSHARHSNFWRAAALGSAYAAACARGSISDGLLTQMSLCRPPSLVCRVNLKPWAKDSQMHTGKQKGSVSGGLSKACQMPVQRSTFRVLRSVGKLPQERRWAQIDLRAWQGLLGKVLRCRDLRLKAQPGIVVVRFEQKLCFGAFRDPLEEQQTLA